LRKLSKSTIMLSEYLATTTSVTLLFILMPREQMCVCEGLGGGDSKGRVQVWTQPPGSWPLQGATCFLYCQAHLIGVQVPWAVLITLFEDFLKTDRDVIRSRWLKNRILKHDWLMTSALDSGASPCPLWSATWISNVPAF
jgi:hypothetical protein